MGRFLARIMLAALAAAGAYALWRALTRAPAPVGPGPAGPRPAPAPAPASWVEPIDGSCPASHPVKAKLASGIYHVAGGSHYERIRPDRCYADPAAAEADGLRASRS